MRYTAFLLCLFALPLQAQIGGDATYQFLNNVASARVAGQGGAAIANPEQDLNFALYNPVLLTPEMHGQFTTSGVDFVGDILYGDMAYAHHYDSVGTFYGQVTFMDYGDFDRANEIGVRQGTFTALDYSFNVGYSYKLDSNWSFGGKLQVIGSQYDVYDSWGTALDLGVTYKIPSEQVAISFLAKNAGFQFDPYTTESENLPFELQLGISNRFAHLPLRLQLTLVQLETWDLRYRNPTQSSTNRFTGEVEDNYPSIWNNILRHMVLGVEFAPSSSFNLQFGYNFRRRQELNLASRRTSAGFSFGGGIRLFQFRVNYSRNIYHIAGAANHISITTDFQKFSKDDKKDAPAD